MPALTATFEANFSKFYDAVDQAVVKLKTFEEGAARVGPRLNAMVDQFSGRKVMEQAALMTKAIEDIGGVGKLTEKELQQVGTTAQEAVAKMRALGIEVPKNLQSIADATKGANQATVDWKGTLTSMAATVGIVFSAQAIAGFIGSVFTAAGAIKDMSLQWDVSTEAVQGFTTAAKLSGGSADDVGRSINTMSRELGEGTSAYAALVSEIGLSAEKLQAGTTEQAFRDMVSAIADIEDPMLQADYAVKLFGKSGLALLPAIRSGFLDTADGATKMSTETVERLEAAGDAWETLKNKVVIYTGEMIAQWMKATPVLLSSVGNFLTGMKKLYVDGRAEYNAWIDEQSKTPGMAAAHVTAVDGMAGAHDRAKGAIRDSNTVLRENAERERLAKKETEDRARALEDARRAQEQYNEKVRGIVDLLSGGGALDKANQWVEVLKHTVPVSQMTRSAQDQINKVMEDAIDVYTALGEQAPEAIYAMANATRAAVPVVGDLQAAIKNLKTEAVEVPRLLGTITMPTMGMMPGAPPPPKPGMFDGYGKGLAAEMSGSIVSAFQGGGDPIKSVGGTIGSYLVDPSKGGIGKAIETGASKLPAMIGGIVGSVVPIIGPMLGPAISLVTKGLTNLFTGGEGAKVNDMRDKFIDAAGGLSQLNMRVVDAGGSITELLKADKVETFQNAVKGLEEQFQFQTQAIDTAMETAQRYGFTLEELGPALQKQELDKQAQQLFKDWEVLNAAGIDTVAITGHMAEGINEYVHKALAMGGEVPAAMKPMLESMVKAGQLTDENGVKIEDLEASGVSFSMTMSEGFKSLITSVDKLASVISKSLGVAIDDTTDRINKVPRNIQVEVEWREKNRPPAQSGEGLEGFQHGTDGYRNFGAGTPVMLHGWEAVVPREGESTAGPALGGGAAPTQIIINAQGAFFDTPGSLQRLADKVNEALTAKFGMSNRMRVA